MNFLFSSYSLIIISSTALLNVFLSIPHKKQVSDVFKEADLGALYNKANSPKPSFAFKLRLTLSLIMTSNVPFSVNINNITLSYSNLLPKIK